VAIIDHPDRNAQFEFINERANDAMSNGQPVISVDSKKKELVGQYKNGGKELRPIRETEEVNIYDFVDKELGRANPYGAYDATNNQGWGGEPITIRQALQWPPYAGGGLEWERNFILTPGSC
jgi:hypothetical protein